MKKNVVNISMILSTLLLLTLGCEQTVDNPDLPYEEQLVIRAVLEAGKNVDDIEITKTLPPLETFTHGKALIEDAEVIIKSDGISDTLSYNRVSQRYYSNDLVPVSGKKYSLEVKYKNLKATAITLVPETVEIDSFYYRKIEEDRWEGEIYWSYIVYAEFIPKSDDVFLGGSSYINDPYINYYYDIKRSRDILQNGKISLPFMYFYPNDTNKIGQELRNFNAHIISFDQAYYNYFITRWEGGGGDDIFGTSGVNVRGNIKGGIGLFIGMSSTEKRIEIK